MHIKIFHIDNDVIYIFKLYFSYNIGYTVA